MAMIYLQFAKGVEIEDEYTKDVEWSAEIKAIEPLL